jgi:serine/threonine protein kinase
MYQKGDSPFIVNETEMTHTSEVGTVTYTAPEVVACEPYGLSSDLWSVGVILLEMVQNHTLEATKNREGYKLIEEAKQKLPDQPFANLVRRLLTVDPHERISARQALESPLFQRFGLDIPPVRVIDIHSALPLEEGDAFIENVKPTKNSNMREKKNPLLVKRQKTIRMLCNELQCEHPMTPYAAFVYSQQMYLQIDDTIDDLSQSQILLDCVVLASKFFELEVRNLEELEEDGTRSFKDWSLEQYYDNEGTIWMLMDHCLYPRGIGFEE